MSCIFDWSQYEFVSYNYVYCSGLWCSSVNYIAYGLGLETSYAHRIAVAYGYIHRVTWGVECLLQSWIKHWGNAFSAHSSVFIYCQHLHTHYVVQSRDRTRTPAQISFVPRLPKCSLKSRGEAKLGTYIRVYTCTRLASNIVYVVSWEGYFTNGNTLEMLIKVKVSACTCKPLFRDKSGIQWVAVAYVGSKSKSPTLGLCANIWSYLFLSVSQTLTGKEVRF